VSKNEQKPILASFANVLIVKRSLSIRSANNFIFSVEFEPVLLWVEISCRVTKSDERDNHCNFLFRIVQNLMTEILSRHILATFLQYIKICSNVNKMGWLMFLSFLTNSSGHPASKIKLGNVRGDLK
jgi:hypothetical protein